MRHVLGVALILVLCFTVEFTACSSDDCSWMDELQARMDEEKGGIDER